MNGDTIDDLVVGAPLADPNGTNSGTYYLIFGSATVGSGGSVDLSSLVNGNGANGYVIKGASVNDGLGLSLSAVGDVNKDNYDDLLIGAPGANTNAGQSYLSLGGNSAHFQTLDNADGTSDGVIDLAFIA